ncbi:thioesterase [Shewanella sp. WXL01]|uniref:Thioesterase n=1 Tax=Shewanella maritima TaxID=2520507 RepID=A0A411PIK3_9GAMM|nr:MULTISPECIES: thioesterase domain-containing protein [Shewanella]NKF52169.1 thioesterase [Shewanella sp. WXL01]QBF83431.1 thioesterase [Shewanella maritima]
MTLQIEQALTELTNTWHQTIPLSQFMQVTPQGYQEDTQLLTVTAPLAPNINLHQTMFAGSIYTLMTLTGWGMVWLQQRLAGVGGDIVLADADVKYLAPVTAQPVAKVSWPSGVDVGALSRGKRLRVNLEVELSCDGNVCARFSGRYVSLPK